MSESLVRRHPTVSSIYRASTYSVRRTRTGVIQDLRVTLTQTGILCLDPTKDPIFFLLLHVGISLVLVFEVEIPYRYQSLDTYLNC
jgi:hypothetical protein